MEKSHVVPRIYGYAVCLVTIIVTLVCVANIVSAIFDRANPVQATSYSYNTYRDVSSFEAYKADIETNSPSDTKEKVTPLTDQQLRDNYEAARTSHIDKVMYGALKTIVMLGSLMGVAIVLFISHWRWLRKLDK